MGSKKYETEKKLAIVEQVVSGKMSLTEASEKIGVDSFNECFFEYKRRGTSAVASSKPCGAGRAS